MMIVSWIGRGGGGGGGGRGKARFWRKSKSSCDAPVEVPSGCSWLDSEIRSEDRRWWTDGCEDGGGDMLLPLFFLFGEAATWK